MAVIGAELHMRRRERIEIGQAFGPIREVRKLAGGGEGRRIDEVHRQRIGRLAAGNRRCILLDEFGKGHFRQRDLVVMAGIIGLDDLLEGISDAASHPHGDVFGGCGGCKH